MLLTTACAPRLQEPTPDERAITVDVGGTPAENVDEILRRLPPKLKPAPA